MEVCGMMGDGSDVDMKEMLVKWEEVVAEKHMMNMS
ncbi:hypothetical protein A2U01_0113274 [Trifolium medium]|uniref:Uncharacterized protein n=1 Tax=Trifolium medium TaxID=97028 RepID=A0A392VUB3_9FABA|nr:hypothetical protein [Trifolium medium]